MGVTERELTRLVESGQLASDEFLRNFIPVLNQAATGSGALAASLETSRVAMQRFNTAVQLNILEAFDAGAEGGLADFFNNLSATINQLSPAFRLVGRLVGGLLSGISIAVRAITQVARPFLNIFDRLFSDTIVQGNEQLRETGSILGNMLAIVRQIAGAFLTVFGAFERFNNAFEEAGNREIIAQTRTRGRELTPIERFSAAFGLNAIDRTFFGGGTRAPGVPQGRGGVVTNQTRNTVEINITANDEGTLVNRINDAIQETLTTSLSPGL